MQNTEANQPIIKAISKKKMKISLMHINRPKRILNRILIFLQSLNPAMTWMKVNWQGWRVRSRTHMELNYSWTFFS